MVISQTDDLKCMKRRFDLPLTMLEAERELERLEISSKGFKICCVYLGLYSECGVGDCILDLKEIQVGLRT